MKDQAMTNPPVCHICDGRGFMHAILGGVKNRKQCWRCLGVGHLLPARVTNPPDGQSGEAKCGNHFSDGTKIFPNRECSCAPTPSPSVGHPEDYCADCGRENPVWHADSATWNAVMRDGEPEPIICPCCFVKRAEAKGVHAPSWRLTIPNPSVGELETPRTDAEEFRLNDRSKARVDVVDSDFARDLERENQRLVGELADAKQSTGLAMNGVEQYRMMFEKERSDLAQAKAQLAQAEADRAEASELCRMATDKLNEERAELFALRAQVEALRK